VLDVRGFDIGDSVEDIPAFTNGKSQLSALEVEETKTIANVRTHMECIIVVPLLL